MTMDMIPLQYDSITDPVEEIEEVGSVRSPAQTAVADSLASASPEISSASLNPVAAEESHKVSKDYALYLAMRLTLVHRS